MGRTRKLVDNVEGNLTKAERAERKQTEKQLGELTKITRTPPRWMDDLAKREYRRITPLLQELPIAALDFALVNSYCVAYSELIQSSERLKTEELVIQTEYGTKINQYQRVRKEAIDTINKIAPKLGMTLDSRMKIMVPPKEDLEDDPFKELFSE